VREPFVRLDYGDAVALVQRKGSETVWGEDLGAPDEKLIVDEYERPVFVVNYPKEAKAFYMKENPADPRTVRCADLLAPEGAGEIIGGSQREDDHDKLRARIVEEGLPLDAYGWYLDLRKYGTFVHSGFGIGLGAHGRVDLRRGAHPRGHPVPRMMERCGRRRAGRAGA
jgi:asparaginyl-tRNA synthetase